MYTLSVMGRYDLDKRAHDYFMRMLKERFGGEPGKLAAALNEPPQIISDLKSQRRRLTHNYIERISELIGVDPMEFYKDPHSRYVTEVHEERAVWTIRKA